MVRRAGGPARLAVERNRGTGVDRRCRGATALQEAPTRDEARIGVGRRRSLRTGVATIGDAGGEIRGHAGGGTGPACRIRARAADQGVRSRAAHQRVVAASAEEDVVACTALEDVVAAAAVEGVGTGITGEIVAGARTDEVLDAGEPIAHGVSAPGPRRVGGSHGEIDGDAAAPEAAREGDRVDAGPAADQAIVAVVIDEVVAAPRVDLDAAVLKVDDVRVIRADDDLEARRDVDASANGVVRQCVVRQEPHGARCARIAERIVAGASVEGIVARATFDRVAARSATEGVGVGIASQHVVVTGAAEALDVREAVPRSISSGGGPSGEIHRHGGVGPGIVDRIAAGTAIDRVGPGTGDDGVIAGAEGDQASRSIDIDVVGEGRTDDILNVRVGIARGVAACPGSRGGIGAGGRTDIDRHPDRGQRVIDRVRAVAAVEGVRPGTGDEGVVPVPTLEETPGAAGRREDRGKPVVVGRADDVLDVAEDVAIGIARRGLRGGEHQVHRHPGGRIRVRHRIGVRATVDRVRTRTGDQRVIARPACKSAAGSERRQAVGKGRADEVLDVGEDIARGVAGGILRRREIEVDGDACGGGRIGRGVRSGTTVEGVVARARNQCVVAGTAGEDAAVRAGGRDQRRQRVIVG